MINIDNDVSLLDEGVWTEFNGSKLKIAHSSNSAFQRALSRRQQPHRRKIEQGTADPQVLRDVMCQAMADALVVDWKEVTDKSGASIAYTPELGYKALKNNPDLREYVTEFSTNLDNFRTEEVNELGKS